MTKLDKYFKKYSDKENITINPKTWPIPYWNYRAGWDDAFALASDEIQQLKTANKKLLHDLQRDMEKQ